MGIENIGSEWLDEESPSDAETPETVEVETEVETNPEPADVAPEPEPQAEQPERPTHTVPYAELKREREKRQELERQLNQRQQPAPEPAKIPDAYEDPEGFNRYNDQRLAQIEWNARASMSERFAIKEHGKELVDAATEWALGQNSPAMAQEILADPDPVGLTIQKYQQSRTLQTLAGRSFEEAARDHAIAQGWIVSPEAQAPSSLKPSASPPPKGLARTPGSGTASPQPDGFDAVFSSTGMGLRK